MNHVLSCEGPLARISQQFVFLFECFHLPVHLNGVSAVPLCSPLSHRSERPSEKNPNKHADVVLGNITDTSCGIDLRWDVVVLFFASCFFSSPTHIDGKHNQSLSTWLLLENDLPLLCFHHFPWRNVTCREVLATFVSIQFY